MPFVFHNTEEEKKKFFLDQKQFTDQEKNEAELNKKSFNIQL